MFTQPLTDRHNPLWAMGEEQGQQEHKSSSTKGALERGSQVAPSACKRLVMTTHHLTLKATACFQGVIPRIVPGSYSKDNSKKLFQGLLSQPRKNHRVWKAICLQKAKLYNPSLISAGTERQLKLNPTALQWGWCQQHLKPMKQPQGKWSQRKRDSQSQEVCGLLCARSLYILCTNASQPRQRPIALFPNRALYQILANLKKRNKHNALGKELDKERRGSLQTPEPTGHLSIYKRKQKYICAKVSTHKEEDLYN